MMRPTLTDALAEARRRSLTPGETSCFLDGAALALHGRHAIAGAWDTGSDAGADWAEVMLARRGSGRSRLLDAISNLYRRRAAA